MLSIGPILLVNSETEDLSKRYNLALIELDDLGVVQAIYITNELTLPAMSDLKATGVCADLARFGGKMTVFDPSIESHEQSHYCLYLTETKQLLRFRFGFPLAESLQSGRWQTFRPVIKAERYNILLQDQRALLSPSLDQELRNTYRMWQMSLLTEIEQGWTLERTQKIDISSMPKTVHDISFNLTSKQQQWVLNGSGFLNELQALKIASKSSIDYAFALATLIQIPLLTTAIREQSVTVMDESPHPQIISTKKSWIFLDRDSKLIKLTPDYLCDNIRILHNFLLIPQINKLSLECMNDNGLPIFLDVQLWIFAVISWELVNYQVHLKNPELQQIIEKDYSLSEDRLSLTRLGSLTSQNTSGGLNSIAVQIDSVLNLMLSDLTNDHLALSDKDHLIRLAKICEGMLNNEEEYWQALEHLTLLQQINDPFDGSLNQQLENVVGQTRFWIAVKTAEEVFKSAKRYKTLTDLELDIIFENINSVDRFCSLFDKLTTLWKKDFLFTLFHNARKFKQMVTCFNDFDHLLSSLHSSNKNKKILYIEATPEYWMTFVSSKEEYYSLYGITATDEREWFCFAKLARLKWPDVLINRTMLNRASYIVSQYDIDNFLSSFDEDYWLHWMPNFKSLIDLTFLNNRPDKIFSYMPERLWHQCIPNLNCLIQYHAGLTDQKDIDLFKSYAIILLDNMPIAHMAHLISRCPDWSLTIPKFYINIIVNVLIDSMEKVPNIFSIVGTIKNFQEMLKFSQDKQSILCEKLLMVMIDGYKKESLCGLRQAQDMLDISTIRVALKVYLRNISRFVSPTRNHGAFFSNVSDDIELIDANISVINNSDELKNVLLRMRVLMEECKVEDKNTTKYINILSYLQKLAFLISVDRVIYLAISSPERKRKHDCLSDLDEDNISKVPSRPRA